MARKYKHAPNVPFYNDKKAEKKDMTTMNQKEV